MICRRFVCAGWQSRRGQVEHGTRFGFYVDPESNPTSTIKPNPTSSFLTPISLRILPYSQRPQDQVHLCNVYDCDKMSRFQPYSDRDDYNIPSRQDLNPGMFTPPHRSLLLDSDRTLTLRM